MNYGRAIKIVRAASGLSQTALAERISIGTSQLSLIESNKRRPSLKVLHEIAVALNVPPHLLTLLGSAPEDLERGIDPQHVQELAKLMLRVLTTAGEQQTLPLGQSTRVAKPRAKNGVSAVKTVKRARKKER